MNHKEKTRDELVEDNARLRQLLSKIEDEIALLKERKDTSSIQEEAARSILKMTQDLFVLKNRNSTYVAVNPAFCRFLNRSEQEIIGKTDRDLFPSEEADMYIRDDSMVMRECKSQIQDEEVTGGKEKRWLQVSKEPVTDDSGVVIGVLCSVRDITDRKAAEKEYQKKLANLKSIKTLTGILPICARCKDIRDNEGRWHPVADYVRDHTEAEFSHGICPSCITILYPYYEKEP